MRPTRSSAPATPVDLAAAKSHLRVTSSDEDGLIQSLLDASTEMVSERTGLVLGAETWIWKTRVVSGSIELPKSPVTAITAMTYVDAAGILQTDTPANYWLLADQERANLRPAPGFSWPATEMRDDAMTITFTAGLPICPPALKTAILMLVAHWFHNRSAVVEGAMADLPQAANALIDLHRLGWVSA
jgi:uncharacterized phiE125 gp8 family phage protein